MGNVSIVETPDGFPLRGYPFASRISHILVGLVQLIAFRRQLLSWGKQDGHISDLAIQVQYKDSKINALLHFKPSCLPH